MGATTLKTCHNRAHKQDHLRAPATYECDLIEQGSLDDLGQRLNHVFHINVANQQPQPEASLQLFDAVMHVLRLQQVKPANQNDPSLLDV